MNTYYVMELPKIDFSQHTKEAIEMIRLEPTYREATPQETIVFLEKKLKKVEKQIEVLKQYLDEDMIESINELESYLHDNTMRKERWV